MNINEPLLVKAYSGLVAFHCSNKLTHFASSKLLEQLPLTS